VQPQQALSPKEAWNGYTASASDTGPAESTYKELLKASSVVQIGHYTPENGPITGAPKKLPNLAANRIAIHSRLSQSKALSLHRIHLEYHCDHLREGFGCRTHSG